MRTGSSPWGRPAAPRYAAALWWAFLAASAAHLAALLAGAGDVARLSKPVLMLLLAGCVAARGAGLLTGAALLAGCAGDTLLGLDSDTAFLCGMAAFAVGHACRLAFFARRGSGAVSSRGGPGLTLLYAALWLGVLAALWPGLPPALRLPVAGYSLLLAATARAAWRLGPVAALGGALFLLSDTLLATGLAHWRPLPEQTCWVMATYLAAQYLLAHAETAAPRAGRAGGTAAEPAAAGG
ncbi:lysoplasmalogenase family protein [Streptomyces sp. NPDC059740]|uniref:lysoplasmalogenase family protein n=1 Tax=Streptomyces sp. NPDC059740 TaxID=3346926 RepID=UPI00364E7B94